MKKVLLVCLVFALALMALSGCHNYPNLDGIPVYNLSFADTGYEKSTKWEAAQGLSSDGTYFYFAGHNDKTKETADIHVIDGKTFEDVTVLKRIGVLHGAEVEYNSYSDTLLVCSGGNKRTPNVREINKTDGSSINYWDFEGVGENGGALIALAGENNLILFTSSEDGARIAFSNVTIKANGEYDIAYTVTFNATDLGVPQGLEIHDGYIYYLADGGRTVSKNPHYIYKMSIDESGITIHCAFSLDFNRETEGFYISDDGVGYFGAANVKIYKIMSNIANWEK